MKIGIRGKILISFLALTLTSVGLISSIAIRSMGDVGYVAKRNTIDLGQTIVTESIAALEDLGRRLIQRRAEHVAEELELYIESHPEVMVYRGEGNLELEEIAVQQVGQTGYTMAYDKFYIVHFHPDPNMVGVNLHEVAGEPTHFWSILERSLMGEASGYYDWEDVEGTVRPKYMHCVSVEGTELIVAAVTYIDEFSAPAEETKTEIASAVLATTQYIDKQMADARLTFIIIIVSVFVVVSGMVFFLARTITGPILQLAKGTEVIRKGELDYSIETKTGDEIQYLAEQFNAMASTLKESYSSLEQKVEQRTKEERQRAEQLRTINEVSRKISSIVNLNELVPYVGDILRETFHYHNVNIFLFEPISGRLTLKGLSVSGQKGFIPVGIPLEVDEEGIVGWVARTGEPLLANDVTKEPRYRAVDALSDTRSELAVAAKIGNRVLGVLDIESVEVDGFSEADMFTAQTLADQLAVAIENARLYEETGQMAVMEERNRMAREIHDTLAQGFTGIILQLEAAEQTLSENSPELERHLNQAGNLARKSLAEARRSVWNLHPQALEQLPLPEALGQEVEKFTRDTGVDARFVASGDRRDLRPELEAGLLRICQEALANVRKHAKATVTEVELVFDESAIRLTVSDDGVGFATTTPTRTSKKRGSFGLISMQERARGLGGTFEVQSNKGEGTLVNIVIPTD